MGATYDQEADVIAVRFAPADAQYIDSVEIAPGLTVDHDQFGRIVAVEILGVAKLLDRGRTTPAGGSYPAPYESAFDDAVQRYSRTFVDQGVPYCAKLGTVDLPVAVAVLNRAVALGQPLGWWGIMRALGYSLPPKGVNL
ncbi:DUF2283 domain-containing protein [Dankookia rubra]|uniref:DUF2283 domain-containing protein n=1 Tax=Dankookia rubra TaxID=1442381 RepID=A0A4R5Q8F3_9PROT|nr:DUF2283 domain-containing protein [Dankookia rubra]